ncbi:HAD family hydrolase [Streptomyces pacificus]|uniref:HAD family hydrolase n=2 Tax=Streptomyces pacificus TaxID=2705029 RepID=A0A6A0AM30_9ACTN|nr:HAD family hydrolase [Streptomyces pacificus]
MPGIPPALHPASDLSAPPAQAAACRTRAVPLPPMGKHSAHVVWDWNGTLLDDIHTVIEATNASFAEIGLGPISLERYRELYCVPVPLFYERLMGRLPTDEEWAAMDAVFHRHYWGLAGACLLTAGAADLLASRQAAGRTQSLLSLAPHEHLVPIVRRHGIEERFVRVDGRVGSSHAGKAEHMVRHVAALGNVPPERIVVVGDAADDALAAAHVGAKAVLYTGGSHSRASLRSSGVPVVDSLAEAVEVAEELVG